MQVRVIAMAGLALGMSTIMISAQEISKPEIVSRTDPSQLEPCVGTPPPGTLWQLPYVGVDRLIPAVAGKNAVEVGKFFRGPQQSDILTAEQRAEIEQGHDGIMLSSVEMFFHEDSVIDPRQILLEKPPQKFVDDLLAASDMIHEEIWPCGKILHAGLTYASGYITSPNGGKRPIVKMLKGPVTQWWSQKGVKTADGKPGARVFVTAPVIPDQGPYQNVPLQFALYEICGNGTGELATFVDSTNVAAKAPPSEPPPPPRTGLRMPPTVPVDDVPAKPASTTAKAEEGPKRSFCGGAIGKSICIGIPAAILCGMFCHGYGGPEASQPAVVVQPVKTGGPGGGPGGPPGG